MGAKKRAAFIPPTIEEVRAYCQERGKGIDPERWLNHYAANGWMRGKTKIVDWKAAVRTWENNQNGHQNGNTRRAAGLEAPTPGKYERLGS